MLKAGQGAPPGEGRNGSHRGDGSLGRGEGFRQYRSDRGVYPSTIATGIHFSRNLAEALLAEIRRAAGAAA